MRRFIVPTTTAAAVALSGLALAPTATAGVDPTVISAKSTPGMQLIKISGPAKAVTSTAKFGDPNGDILRTDVTVHYPGGGKSTTATATGSPGTGTRTFDFKYTPSNATAPGKYKVTFKAVPSGTAFSGPVVATAKFVVKHKTRLIVFSKARSYNPGANVRFYGSFYPHYNHAKGKKLILSVDKAGGKKKFVKVGTTKVNKSATYNFSPVRVWKTGKYRVTFKGDKYSLKDQVTIKRQVF